MNPDDPFGGGGGKTVVRPNPGGAAPGGQRPQPGGMPQPGGAPPPPQQGWPQPGGGQQGWPQPGGQPPPMGQPMPGGPQQGNPPPLGTPFVPPAGPGFNNRVNAQQVSAFNSPGHGMPAGQQDAWLAGSSPQGAGPAFPSYQQPQAPQQQVAKIPLDVALNARDGGQISAANPITAAAAPLLILLGRLRLMIIDMQAIPLMQHVANEIVAFDQRIRSTGVDPHDAEVAKYALCATADDIVQNLPGTDKSVWLQYSMVAQFYRVRNSGVGFYEELSKIMHNPGPRYDLLELMHACLSLGFEGQHRGTPNGANQLAAIRRDVYQTLRHLKSRSDDDISPRWRGLDLKMSKLTSRIPLWAIASAAAAILLGVYLLLRFLLGGDADVLADRIVALHPTSQITLERAAFAPAVIPDVRDQSQLERIRGNLGDVGTDGCVNADSVGDVITISVCNVLLFDSGSATVKPEFEDLATRIARSLQNEPGTIDVIGHTDNVPLSGTGRFKSNYDLSVARAEGVKVVMARLLDDPTRLVVEGRGELEPVADNSTPEGRSQNRRVEILIPREETLPRPAP